MRAVIKRITTVEQREAVRTVLRRLRPVPKVDVPRFADRLHEFSAPYRLHLGCGNIKLAGFCNVDALETIAADAIDDIRTLGRFPDGSAREIYACHVLEHFGHDEVIPLLKRWYAVLQPGGVIRISVPDLDRIVRIYHKNWEHFQKPGNTPWIGLIYGGQSTPYDFHKTGFNANWLRHLLEQCGFEQCEEYPHEPHFVPGTVDASVANATFGEYFSLNMMARRPL
ncbi:class I SAM-dependent methyltransferase [Cupriavidus plantarum]|uniref:Putative SAM-dependent methyltransferase n=1 Tax=Cupriavidus plantarum TaxID=942865 RepID=A0A316F1W1_9BURK|nr:methyltransferase domain-containing protein [Cupriavidus plantarum]PWK37718.1 putative SAM-dependent methyltransferase [Cupriavidus plantarum]